MQIFCCILMKEIYSDFYFKRPKTMITGLHFRFKQHESWFISSFPLENTKMPENEVFLQYVNFLYIFFSLAEIYQLGAYKTSAFDDCLDYKRNAGGVDCKDIALHGLSKLFYNVWYEASTTFHPGRDTITTG